MVPSSGVKASWKELVSITGPQGSYSTGPLGKDHTELSVSLDHWTTGILLNWSIREGSY
jgi:hypothetical protein